jgi:hypothetical protein
MINDLRVLGSILSALLFILCFIRLHKLAIRAPAFVLYLSLCMAWGWMLMGDIGYWVSWIDLGVLEKAGLGYRLLGFKVLVMIGLIYVNITGPCRKDNP